jgi:D-beta-D-heptose 7-phosphate kinase/D-beta-D-heptose 1-phosphate adenosyltransferase
VLASGCFDLFHSGHISYLNAAKGLGDHLMVGVNSDASAARVKGPGRPIIKLDERMELLASMQMVDSVVSFAESTPLNLIETVSPHILVKGEEWGEQTVIGREWVEANGGEVALIPMKEGHSITSLIRRITERQPTAPAERFEQA